MIIRAARQWWTQSHHDALLQSQSKLINSLIRSPVSSQSNDVLNSVEFVSPPAPDSPTRDNDNNDEGNDSRPTVVMAHGFGSGLGFFFRNVDPLLQSGKVRRVVLVDWLGMGGSDRPPCRRPMRGYTDWGTSWCDSRFTPTQAVHFFIDPLESWLEKRNLRDNVWLVGHSLGGYLAAQYAMRYPKRVEKLVLASPVGFPPKPTNVLPQSEMPPPLRLVDALWNANVTPQQLVRLMGSTRGRRNVERALKGRIPHLSQGDVSVLSEYLYHITVAHPSGEYAMNSLLQPAMSSENAGVFAREPLEERLATELVPSIQLRVLYGEHDWMRPNEGSARAVIESLRRRDVNADLRIISNAGHHLYLDNSPSFVEQILKE